MANSRYVVVSHGVATTYQHRDVWQAAHGAIPDGWHVHHKNGDTRDNRLENLECLPKSEHHRRHMKELTQDEQFMSRLRSRASVLGKRKRTLIKFNCAICGSEAERTAETRHGVPRYCGQKCGQRAAYLARKAAGYYAKETS